MKNAHCPKFLAYFCYSSASSFFLRRKDFNVTLLFVELYATYMNDIQHFAFFFQRSLKREHLIIKWILRITHLDKDMSIDFADWVQDGTVLSQ